MRYIIVIMSFIFFASCNKTIEPENDAPKIEVIGFVGSDTLTFELNKKYEFEFQVMDNDGDKFTLNFHTDPDFGQVDGLTKGNDGMYSAFYTPLQKGKHRITIIANDKLEKSTKILSVFFSVNIFPNADFTFVAENLNFRNKTFTYRFDPTRSNDPDGRIEKVIWNFDGEIVNGNPQTTTSYTFRRYGTFNVKLEVWDNHNFSSVDSAEVYNDLLDLDISIIKNSGAGFPVVYQFRANAKNDGSPIEYFWKLGDGTSSKLKDMSHGYTQYGVYNIECTASDRFGEVTKKMQLEVAQVVKTEAKFTFENNSWSHKIKSKEAFAVDASTSIAGDGSVIVKYDYYYQKLPGGKETFLKSSTTQVTTLLLDEVVGQYKIGLKITTSLGMESPTVWNKLEILNSPPQASVYRSRKSTGLGTMWKLTVKVMSVSDIDKNDAVTWKWYRKDKGKANFHYISGGDMKTSWGSQGMKYNMRDIHIKIIFKDKYGGVKTVVKKF